MIKTHQIVTPTASLYLALATCSSGALPASDVASNYTTATWLNGSNLGTGFGPWGLGVSLSKAIESSSLNGGTPNIDSGPSAFRISRAAGNAAFEQVQRQFTAGGSNGLQELGSGQTFKFSLDYENLNVGATVAVGFWLTDPDQGERWGLQHTGGQPFLQIKTNGGPATVTNIPVASLNNGARVKFDLLAAGAWTATLSKQGGTTYVLDSETYGTVTANPTGFRFFQANNTNNGSLTHYINKIAVMETLPDYAGWADNYEIPGAPATGDADNDGLKNGVEYALGLDPNVPNGPPGEFDGNEVTFTKGAEAIRNGDVTYIIQESDDLGIADPWAAVATQLPTDSDPTISHVLPAGKQRVFVRLNVNIQ